jgi:lysophospholipase L1-like esterase
MVGVNVNFRQRFYLAMLEEFRGARLLRAAAAVAAFANVFFALSGPARADNQIGDHWVATWGASPSAISPTITLNNQTVREIALVTIGGRGQRLRIQLTNEFGGEAVTVGEAHIALPTISGGSLQPNTDRTLSFGGRTSFTIPPGAPVISDPVDFDLGSALPNLGLVAVSLYFPNATTVETLHPNGWQTAYITNGNTTGAANLNVVATTHARLFLSRIDIVAAPGAIVALGDSITDGDGSTPDASGRWPDYLAERLANVSCSTCLPAAFVVNEGISGNQLLRNDASPSALARFDRDVLSIPGAQYVIVLEGINDIGSNDQPGMSVTADELIAGYRQLIPRAHSQGLYIYGGTLTPFHGSVYDPLTAPRPDREQLRQTVNNWIRASGEFDAVIDFDAVLRDPAAPAQLSAAYDSGDHIHPSDAGYQAIGNAISLSLFGL